MSFQTIVRISLLILAGVFSLAVHPYEAVASHARIIRLSLVQGEVRVMSDSKGDPLANDKANWQRAELNLPIREHQVIATDNGRAEVEFENGAMAFLDANSVLEFFDLSLEDGALTTRLILRQGTASFYVNPARGDYFSVTGGDFTAEAAGKTNFRMDTFDDGSTVAVNKGHISVVYKDDSTTLAKGQSLTMRAGVEVSASVGRTPDSDEFDRWVSGREDSVVTATNAAMQYSNSSTYTSGFADLYTYGGFYPVAGFGYGWRPFGAGFGWSPFNYGNWFLDPTFGWSFIGNQPWGWLPYHYGGWIFQPGVGWLWTPAGFGSNLPPVKFHPVTATFVRSGSNVGIVPSHPLDHGKTALNLGQGVMPLAGRGGAENASAGGATKWKVVKQAPNEALPSAKAGVVAAPARIARTVDSSAAAHVAAGSSIVYDAKEHRFVNSNVPASSMATVSGASSGRDTAAVSTRGTNAAAAAATDRGRSTSASTTGRAAPPAASARAMVPPPAPRTFVSASGESSVRTSGARGATTTMSTPTRSTGTSAPARGSAGGSGRPH